MAALFALAGVPAAAQNPQARSNPNIDPKQPMRQAQEREASLRSAELLVVTPRDTKEGAAAVEEVKRDYKRLQVLRNDLARRLVAGGPLDLKFVARTADEVNKRASRLKDRLMLLDPNGDAHRPDFDLADEKLQPALVALCKGIDRFVASPVFDLAGVADVHEHAQAGGDLLVVIQLSESIKKTAERMSKADR